MVKSQIKESMKEIVFQDLSGGLCLLSSKLVLLGRDRVLMRSFDGSVDLDAFE